MRRFLRRWLLPFVAAGCLLPAATAQPPSRQGKPADTRPANPPRKSNEPPENTERTPGVQYLFALVTFLVVIFIVCKPSRKN
jgi:hypothetical protein